ncbi:uncharacterized protein LOC110111058 isoform X1 [Dendrobium catenatum]|uniref:uncharacterized protein LOC110111058 isoform X1 n=1 Tax=Dendrobium catenatum TaxID=906689 RepID=UPI00109F641E|nr:uncharacterized protein LOC110111058 isoform X1 [Dendrobium catenatum]
MSFFPHNSSEHPANSPLSASPSQHVQEFRNYFRYAFWWVTLGVASSIGLALCHSYAKDSSFWSMQGREDYSEEPMILAFRHFISLDHQGAAIKEEMNSLP